MKTFDGKVVVITGAASGIGRALAVESAGRGARVAISDVDSVGLDRTAQLATEAGAREVATDPLDVSDRAAVTAYADAVRDRFGQVNVIVNNAGVALSGDFVDLSYTDMEWIVGVNFWGVVHGTRAFLPHLIDSGDGHVVNMSSIFGMISMPGQSLYNATKYAVRGLTEALREEMLVAGHPVGVTAVHPGGIRTAIARNGRVSSREDQQALARIFDTQLARTDPEDAARTIVKGVLAGRPRVLVGIDAHLLHHAGHLSGAGYQRIVALAKRTWSPGR